MKLFFFAGILLAAGMISPSNGVDDGVSKEPLTMLVETCLIIFAVLLIYIFARNYSADGRDETAS